LNRTWKREGIQEQPSCLQGAQFHAAPMK
jgi:hypothetical protein